MPLLLALLLCGAPALAGESTITLAAPGALFPKQVKVFTDIAPTSFAKRMMHIQ